MKKGGASFGRSKVAPYTMSLLEVFPYFSDEIQLQNVEEAHPHIQPLSNDKLLIVAARCDYRGGNPEQNAAVYNRQGDLERRFVMGDGIEDVQVGCDGTIWASYFDEGVFGNYGWREAVGGAKPLGASGVVRFDATGKALWRFEPSYSIADCYAMNVTEAATWLCYYTNFPIVCIKPDGAARAWHNEITGARSLVTDGQRVLLFGGYKDNRKRCVVQDLAAEKMERARAVIVELEGDALPDQVRAIGRGSILHIFSGTNWYQLNLAAHDL